MIPADNLKTNFTVDKILLVKGSIVTPLLKTGAITIDGKTLDQILSETVPNIDTTNLVATNLTSENITSTNITTSNLFLPTTGGVPTSLTYYEEFVGTTTFTSTAFAGTQTVDMLLTRVGNMVTMQLSGISVTGTGVQGAITNNASGVPLPTRFMPRSAGGDSIFVIQVRDNNVPMPGRFTLSTNGFFNVVKSTVSGSNLFINVAFSGVGVTGFAKFSISWIV